LIIDVSPKTVNSLLLSFNFYRTCNWLKLGLSLKKGATIEIPLAMLIAVLNTTNLANIY